MSTLMNIGKRVVTPTDLKLRGLVGSIPPTGLVLLSVSSTQIGAALAKGLFTALGSAGTVSLRVGFAALILFLIWRPRVRGHTRTSYMNCVLFGLALATMNLCFYSALARIPLGIAVTLEFVGPLSVAIMGSRRLLMCCGLFWRQVAFSAWHLGPEQPSMDWVWYLH